MAEEPSSASESLEETTQKAAEENGVEVEEKEESLECGDGNGSEEDERFVASIIWIRARA